VLGRHHLGDIAGIVTPDTILRWYRRLVAKKYDGSKQRAPGRPRTKPDIAALVVRMANENPTWGYTRIRGG
jgi:putative transposase